MDEHRLGLKPVRRRVWAPIGARPIALGHHRYEWLYVTAFVTPATGEAVWYLSNGIDKAFFAELLAAFARATDAGRKRIIVLALDNAGWHGPARLEFPDGIIPVYLPPYSPDLNPIEQVFAKFKAALRKAAARTVTRLWQEIAKTLNTFSPRECAAYLKHCGYAN